MTPSQTRPLLLALIFGSAFLAPGARASGGEAASLPVFTLAMKDGKFEPKTLTIPSGVKIKLLVSNEDAGPIEFESFSLHREQVVLSRERIAVFLGPLKAGTYDFFDDFHPGAAGTIAVSSSTSAR